MTIHHLRPAAAFALACLAALPALAQYKIVRPDGSVTYTDRPPIDPGVRVTTLGRNTQAQVAAAEVALPVELRQAVSRYPVTLYTGPDCAPCDSARRMLQKRGVPYSERTVTTEEDATALERAVGGRSIPALTVGAQPLRGFSEADWASYLDVAGYPRESKLPRNWPPTVAAPLVERAPATPARASTPPVIPGAEIDTSPQTGIRF